MANDVTILLSKAFTVGPMWMEVQAEILDLGMGILVIMKCILASENKKHGRRLLEGGYIILTLFSRTCGNGVGLRRYKFTYIQGDVLAPGFISMIQC